MNLINIKDLLTVFAESSILDVCLDSKYASVACWRYNLVNEYTASLSQKYVFTQVLFNFNFESLTVFSDSLILHSHRKYHRHRILQAYYQTMRSYCFYQNT